MAKSRNIGSIFAELTLRDEKFRKGAKGAQSSLAKLGGIAGKVGKTVAVAGTAAGTAMAAGLAVGTKKTIAMGAELDHLSSQTGVAVSSLMKIQQAYKDAGKGADTAGKDINKMQRAIYEAAQAPGTTVDYFADIGLSAQALMSMRPEEQFFAIGDALKGVENQTKQAAVAMDIFGRSGGELLTVFKGSSLEDVNAALGRMPEIMEQMSVQLERADTLMGRLPNKADQFFAGFTSGIIGEILPGLEAVNDKDFTTLGESLGNAIGDGLRLLTSGDAWAIFNKGAEIAVLKLDQKLGGFMNSFTAHMLAIGDVVTGKGGFNEQLLKYLSAGDTAEEDIKRLESEISNMLNTNKLEKMPVLGPMHPDFLPDGFNGFSSDSGGEKVASAIREGVETGITQAMNESKTGAPWQSPDYSVNSMQARGLSYGSFVGKAEEQQVTLLAAIRDILQTSTRRDDGRLLWPSTV